MAKEKKRKDRGPNQVTDGGCEEGERKYPLGITVAQSEGVELREERGLDGDDLRVQLRRSRHGRCARQ